MKFGPKYRITGGRQRLPMPGLGRHSGNPALRNPCASRFQHQTFMNITTARGGTFLAVRD
jgi:hypothetical protein